VSLPPGRSRSRGPALLASFATSATGGAARTLLSGAASSAAAPSLTSSAVRTTRAGSQCTPATTELPRLLNIWQRWLSRSRGRLLRSYFERSTFKVASIGVSYLLVQRAMLLLPLLVHSGSALPADEHLSKVHSSHVVLHFPFVKKLLLTNNT